MSRILNIPPVANAPHEPSRLVCLPHFGVSLPMTSGIRLSPFARTPFSIVGDLSIADIRAGASANRARGIQSP